MSCNTVLVITAGHVDALNANQSVKQFGLCGFAGKMDGTTVFGYAAGLP